jgi:exonuclease SbcC
MKLLSIRLRPFGATRDRQVVFGDGITVLFGPNEAGKSTLREALRHAVLTSTKLTPAVLRKSVGRWYPAPGGDHASVTLRFEAEGQTWVLEKTWGAGSRSSLAANGGPALQDADGVQQRLAELFHWNRATWEKVLFTGQAELASTTSSLEANADGIDDVRAFLSGPSALPDDIASDKIREALDEQINKHFQRWDMLAYQPEKARGINNPWKVPRTNVCTI